MTIRGGILEQAKNLTEGDRNKAYGEPFDNMDCFTSLIAVYFEGISKTERYNPQPGVFYINPIDGAIIMALAKISRIAANPFHRDNYVDLSAYAAIAGECAERLDKEIKNVQS